MYDNTVIGIDNLINFAKRTGTIQMLSDKYDTRSKVIADVYSSAPINKKRPQEEKAVINRRDIFADDRKPNTISATLPCGDKLATISITMLPR